MPGFCRGGAQVKSRRTIGWKDAPDVPPRHRSDAGSRLRPTQWMHQRIEYFFCGNCPLN
ncbi:hypothetical protein DO70_4907 [Burkholderia pseudomallei]|nr:hypothetical protein DO70_4907 [Burkholderia pseudomallei]